MNDSAVLPNISQYWAETKIFNGTGKFGFAKWPDAIKTITMNVEISRKASTLCPNVEGILSGFPPVCGIFFLAGNRGFGTGGFLFDRDLVGKVFFFSGNRSLNVDRRGFFTERNFARNNFIPPDDLAKSNIAHPENFARSKFVAVDKHPNNILANIDNFDHSNFADSMVLVNRKDRNDFVPEAKTVNHADICKMDLT